MKSKQNGDHPTLGRHTFSDGERWSTLRGNWSMPPTRAASTAKRLCIYYSDGFTGNNTEFLNLFPHLQSVRMSLNSPLDFSGLYQLSELTDLWILASWFPPCQMPVLDLSRISKLSRLYTPFFAGLRGLASLRGLTHLHLDHVYGVEELDFSPHPKLVSLELGPANGVSEVCLEGLSKLRSLSLVCMRNLMSITGTEFYDTVMELDIRASNRIPASTLARFSRLKQVMIGTKSRITSDSFPLCAPKVLPFPV